MSTTPFTGDRSVIMPLLREYLREKGWRYEPSFDAYANDVAAVCMGGVPPFTSVDARIYDLTTFPAPHKDFDDQNAAIAFIRANT